MEKYIKVNIAPSNLGDTYIITGLTNTLSVTVADGAYRRRVEVGSRISHSQAQELVEMPRIDVVIHTL